MQHSNISAAKFIGQLHMRGDIFISHLTDRQMSNWRVVDPAFCSKWNDIVATLAGMDLGEAMVLSTGTDPKTLKRMNHSFRKVSDGQFLYYWWSGRDLLSSIEHALRMEDNARAAMVEMQRQAVANAKRLAAAAANESAVRSRWLRKAKVEA